MKQTPTKRGRVLIVEDEYLISSALKLQVERMGLEVVAVARDGEQAVAQALALSPDLILMDLGLPKLDGLEAITEIMSRRPTGVIVLSAYDDDRISRARAAGAVANLVKPIWEEELEEVISCALAAAPGGSTSGEEGSSPAR